jgi:peroxiredoxin family protein
MHNEGWSMNEQIATHFADLETIVENKVLRALEEKKGAKRKRLAIVASKGTLDMVYPPLILASTAAALGWEVGVFCTFYGLDILNKKKLNKYKVASVGNPAMPIPVPNILGALPGMTRVATWMMKRWMKKANMPDPTKLLQNAIENGVKFYACTTTLGVMGVGKENIIKGVTFAGAAGFLDFASEAETTLFI